MKKKNLWYLLAIVVVTVLSVNFEACNKDDDDKNSGGGASSGLVGTWQKMDDDGTLKHILWVFEASGTMYEHDIDDQGNIKEGSTETFKYKVENQHLYTDELRDDGKSYEGEWEDAGAISIANGILTVTRDSGKDSKSKVKRFKKIK